MNINKQAFTDITKKEIEDYFKDNAFEQSIFKGLTIYDSLAKQFNNLFELIEDWYSLQNYIKYKQINDNYNFVKYLADTNIDDLVKDVYLSRALDKADLVLIKSLAENAVNLYSIKSKIELHLTKVAKQMYPNTENILGPILTLRLINLTKGLSDFASLPSSTIQMIGAESALFRHLKYNKDPPKYGFIFQHPALQNIKPKDKGKMARFIANKVAIASKLDLNGKPIDKSLLESIEKKKIELEKSK